MKKNIILDLRFLTKNKTGIGFYTEKIYKELIRRKESKFLYKGVIFLENMTKKQKIYELVNNVNIIKLKIPYYSDPPVGIRNMLFWSIPAITKKIFFKKRINIYHCFHYFIPHKKLGDKLIITIHDLTPIIYPEYFLNEVLEEKWLEDMKIKCDKSDLIITVSEYSKKDIIKYLNIDENKIKVVSPGIDLEEYGKKVNDNEIKKKYRLKDNYILYLGTLQPRKNIINIMKSFEKLNLNNLQLVIAGGKGWSYDEIFYEHGKNKLKENIVILDYIDEKDKVALYKGAKLFIFPSFYEGFGMPVLEAMAAGTPVITSNVSSLPEVSGGAALLVDPYNIDEISEAINKVLKDIELRKNMIELGLKQAERYTWENSVDKLLKIYEDL